MEQCQLATKVRDNLMHDRVFRSLKRVGDKDLSTLSARRFIDMFIIHFATRERHCEESAPIKNDPMPVELLLQDSRSRGVIFEQKLIETDVIRLVFEVPR